jgi:hypothetical protein
MVKPVRRASPDRLAWVAYAYFRGFLRLRLINGPNAGYPFLLSSSTAISRIRYF